MISDFLLTTWFTFRKIFCFLKQKITVIIGKRSIRIYFRNDCIGSCRGWYSCWRNGRKHFRTTSGMREWWVTLGLSRRKSPRSTPRPGRKFRRCYKTCCYDWRLWKGTKRAWPDWRPRQRRSSLHRFVSFGTSAHLQPSACISLSHLGLVSGLAGRRFPSYNIADLSEIVRANTRRHPYHEYVFVWTWKRETTVISFNRYNQRRTICLNKWKCNPTIARGCLFAREINRNATFRRFDLHDLLFTDNLPQFHRNRTRTTFLINRLNFCFVQVKFNSIIVSTCVDHIVNLSGYKFTSVFRKVR